MSSNSSDGATVVPFFLDGQSVAGSATFPVISAATGEAAHRAYTASIDDALAAAASCGRAFKTWRDSTYPTRRTLLQKVAEIFMREAEEFVRLQCLETSAPEDWARVNVNGSVAYLQEIAARVSGVEGAIPQNEKPGALSFIFKEPVGPVLCIPPWNAALVLATRGTATAIAAGCTVVLKASELCPATHFKIVQCFVEAGLPPGVLNSIQVERNNAAEVTEALIADQNIRKVEFIGSANVGRAIGTVAAKHLKPVLMELGGKCPSIILDDADMEKATDACAKGALANSGQICFSTERIIFVKGAASDLSRLESLLVEAFQRNHSPGSSTVHRAGAQHASDLLADAKAKGARFLIDGPAFDSPASLRPSLVLQPTKDMRIRDEETFGPSASLYIVDSDDEAIALANESAYGLNAAIHTRDLARGMRMARQLEYGQVHLNSPTTYVSPTGSQGGVKGSGYGRQNSKYGLEEFLVNKFVSFHG